MTDSEIINNTTTECGESPQNEETTEGHRPGCMCECCCQISEVDCHNNLSTCETLPTMKVQRNMKNRLVPSLANCAMVLVLIGLGTIGHTASAIDRHGLKIGAVETKISIDSAALAITTAEVVNIIDWSAIDASTAGGTDVAIDLSHSIINPIIDARGRSSIKAIRQISGSTCGCQSTGLAS